MHPVSCSAGKLHPHSHRTCTCGRLHGSWEQLTDNNTSTGRTHPQGEDDLDPSARRPDLLCLWGICCEKDITISWDSPIKADMSLTNLLCFLQSKPLKRLYRMVNGIEVPESQHQQFAGRVQCDRGALRDGRLRLHLSRVTTDDSGTYWCDLAADYDHDLRRWVLQTSEQFVLKVTSHGDNNDVIFTTPEAAKQTPGGPEEGVSSYDWNKVKTSFGAVQVGIFLLGSTILAVLTILKICLTGQDIPPAPLSS